MTLVLQPCGSIGFSGDVLGGLQTSSNGIEASIVGGAVVVWRDSSETVLASPGRDNKVWESSCSRGCSARCDNSIARTPDTELPTCAGSGVHGAVKVRQAPGNRAAVHCGLGGRRSAVGPGLFHARTPLQSAQSALTSVPRGSYWV